MTTPVAEVGRRSWEETGIKGEIQGRYAALYTLRYLGSPYSYFLQHMAKLPGSLAAPPLPASIVDAIGPGPNPETRAGWDPII